jgi:DNA-binding response OmpR family regulator
MARRTVLVVEDDAAIRRGMVDALTYDGYEVLQAADGRTGRQMALTASYDLLLLDLVLPGGDGFEILRALRLSRPTAPVIITTARGAESDRVRGLRDGADDYVVKPLSVIELLARVQAVLRRSAERPTDVEQLPLPGGTADLLRREARFDDGSRVELSEREVELLRYLAAHPGRAVSREEIIARVWRLNPQAVSGTRTIDMHVARLREKLRDEPSAPAVILTVRGMGYMVAPPDEGSG